VHSRPRWLRNQRFEPGQERRRHEQQHEREQDDIPAGRAARGEELAVLPEQVEQRLGHREGPEDEQVQRCGAQAQGQPRGRAR